MYARTAPNVCEIAYTYLMVRLAVPLFREERQTSHAVLARTVWSHRGCIAIGLLADVGKVSEIATASSGRAMSIASWTPLISVTCSASVVCLFVINTLFCALDAAEVLGGGH